MRRLLLFTLIVVLLLTASSALAQITPTPNSTDGLSGRWTGAVDQPGSVPYSVILELTDCRVGQVCGTSTYPELECGGDITLLSREGDGFHLRENITYGPCILEVLIELEPLDADTWRISYFEVGYGKLGGAIVEAMSAASANVDGAWRGSLFQPSGGFETEYPFEMTLVQDGNRVSGTSRIEGGDGWFAVMSLEGTVTDGVFTFQELEVVDQSIGETVRWCIKVGTLTLSADGQRLEGTWDEAQCEGGSIRLSRVD